MAPSAKDEDLSCLKGLHQGVRTHSGNKDENALYWLITETLITLESYFGFGFRHKYQFCSKKERCTQSTM